MRLRPLFRRRNNRRLSAIRGYQRAASGAEAPPVVTQAVYAVNSALLEKREGLRTQSQ